jgi:hypothetical protein
LPFRVSSVWQRRIFSISTTANGKRSICRGVPASLRSEFLKRYRTFLIELRLPARTRQGDASVAYAAYRSLRQQALTRYFNEMLSKLSTGNSESDWMNVEIEETFGRCYATAYVDTDIGSPEMERFARSCFSGALDTAYHDVKIYYGSCGACYSPAELKAEFVEDGHIKLDRVQAVIRDVLLSAGLKPSTPTKIDGGYLLSTPWVSPDEVPAYLKNAVCEGRFEVRFCIDSFLLEDSDDPGGLPVLSIDVDPKVKFTDIHRQEFIVEKMAGFGFSFAPKGHSERTELNLPAGISDFDAASTVISERIQDRLLRSSDTSEKDK